MFSNTGLNNTGYNNTAGYYYVYPYSGMVDLVRPSIPTTYPTAPQFYRNDGISHDALKRYIAERAAGSAVKTFLEKPNNSGCKVLPDIERVIRHDRATIIYWADNTRTVVRCKEGDQYDPYYGFCACVCKKLYGGSSAVRDIAGIPREPRKNRKKKRNKGDLAGRGVTISWSGPSDKDIDDIVKQVSRRITDSVKVDPPKPKTYQEWVSSIAGCKGEACKEPANEPAVPEDYAKQIKTAMRW